MYSAGASRVLGVIDSLEVGGAQQHLLTLASALRPRGYQYAIATAGNEPLSAQFERSGIPVLTLARRTTKHRLSPTFIGRLVQLASSGKFDLIHAHLHSASVAAACAAHFSGLPLVITHHSMNTWHRSWHRALDAWADRRADAVIAVASNVGSVIEGHGVRPEIIPNGIPGFYAHQSASQATLIRAGLVPPGAYLVGFVGRFCQDKNPLLFVEVAALVAERCESAHFVLIGDGPLRPAAEERARCLGLDDRITFAGFVPNAAELHEVLDVLAVTSDSEASPLVVLEAMRAGRPVVATAVGDIPRQVAPGETGFLLPYRDAPGLAAALVALADRSLQDRLGQAGRTRFLAHFSIAGAAVRTADVYARVLRRVGLRSVPAA